MSRLRRCLVRRVTLKTTKQAKALVILGEDQDSMGKLEKENPSLHSFIAKIKAIISEKR